MKRLSFITLQIISLSCVRLTESGDNLYNICFTARQESIISESSLTKTTFGYGNRASVMIFSAGSLSGFKGGTPLYAVAVEGGLLSHNEEIALTRGVYDIYSLSYNSSNPPIVSFNNGVSGEPQNSIDYLWASSKDLLVDSDKVINFNYKRLSCRIILKVVPDSSYKNITFNNIKFTLPSVNNTFIDLNNGTISPSGNADELTPIEGTGDTRTFIIIPTTASLRTETEISGEINGDSFTSRRFGADLGILFESGNSYTIVMQIDGQKEVVISYEVSPWRFVHNYITYSLSAHL
jgi:hypothetical protein